MGRMLESLLKGEGNRSSIAGRIHVPAAPSGECVVDWTLADEEVPYVEVGGPGKKVELSANLMKHPPQPSQPPHVEAVVCRPSAVGAEPRGMSVAFEPWPEGGAALAVAPEVVAFHKPAHAASQAYVALLDRMLQGLATPGPRVIQLAGSRPGAGTTTVLANLAVTAARSGKQRVIAADMNLAAPALALRLGHAAKAGSADVLAGRVAPQQALGKSAVPGLMLLPGSAPAKAPISPEAAAWLAAWLRDRADLIFIDGPPLAETASVASLTACGDGLYVVLGNGEPLDRGPVANGGRLRGLIYTRFEA